MKSKIKFNLLWICCLAMFVACGGGSSAHHEESGDHDHDHDHETATQAHSDEIIFTPEKAKAAGLEVQTIALDTFHQVIKTSGQILSAQGDEVTIAATSNGLVTFSDAAAADGVAVRSGERIASISAKEIATGDPVAQAKITYETAQKEYQRSESLVKDKIISEKDFEQARLKYETAKTAYQAFENKSGAHGVSVTTPIAGYIKNRFVSQGSFVSIGQPIATVSQNRRLQLRAEVSEKYFKDLQAIGSANFKVPYSDKVYKLDELKGRLLSFGKSSGENSFYVPVTFEFDNIGDMVPGSYAEVYLLSLPLTNTIVLPQKAITEEQGLYFVYLQVDEEGYKKREVTLGESDGDRVQVLTGLQVGDRVVTKGVYQLKLASYSGAIPGHTHNH